MQKRMGCKACDEPKPQQPVGCEDLGEEYNAADRLFCAPLFHTKCGIMATGHDAVLSTFKELIAIRVDVA